MIHKNDDSAYRQLRKQASLNAHFYKTNDINRFIMPQPKTDDLNINKMKEQYQPSINPTFKRLIRTMRTQGAYTYTANPVKDETGNLLRDIGKAYEGVALDKILPVEPLKPTIDKPLLQDRMYGGILIDSPLSTQKQSDSH